MALELTILYATCYFKMEIMIWYLQIQHLKQSCYLDNNKKKSDSFILNITFDIHFLLAIVLLWWILNPGHMKFKPSICNVTLYILVDHFEHSSPKCNLVGFSWQQSAWSNQYMNPATSFVCHFTFKLVTISFLQADTCKLLNTQHILEIVGKRYQI